MRIGRKQKLEAKSIEIENLNRVTKLLKDDNIEYTEKKKHEYEAQMKELIRKKNYYKSQVLVYLYSANNIIIIYRRLLRN